MDYFLLKKIKFSKDHLKNLNLFLGEDIVELDYKVKKLPKNFI